MEHKCPCGKFYSHLQGLYRHRKNCVAYTNPTQPVEAQPVDTVKSNVEHEELLEVQQQYYKQLLEEQEKHFKQLLQEKDKLLDEKDKLLNEKDKLLDEKDKRIEEQKQTIEFMKTITMQRPSIVQVPTVTPTQIQTLALAPTQEVKAPVEVKQPKKHFNLKEYLNSRNPITIDEFYDNYKPTIEEYDNICRLGITNGIIINFANYAKTYGDRCPIIVSNVQYERLHVHVFKTIPAVSEDEKPIVGPLEEKWTEYERIDAQLYMKDNIVIRFVNKYQKYISVFNEKYMDCLKNPSNIADNNSHMEKKLGLTKAINTADQVSDKISKELAYKLAINRDEQ